MSFRNRAEHAAGVIGDLFEPSPSAEQVKAIADAVEIASVEHFYRPAHAHVYDAISTLYAAGDPVDPVTVAEELDRSGVLETIGGLDGLISLQVNTPATSNASKYASIVQERFTLRRLIEVAGEIAEIGYGRPDDVSYCQDDRRPFADRNGLIARDGRRIILRRNRRCDRQAGRGSCIIVRHNNIEPTCRRL